MANRARYTGLSIALAVVVGTLGGLGCSSDDTPEPGTGSSGSATATSGGASGAAGSSSGAAERPLDTIDGIDIPVTLTLCGALVPTVSDEDVGFDWSGAPPETTQYALRLAKSAPGSTSAATLAEKVQAETTIAVGERTAGVSYRIDVYALQDRTPLCTLGGVNVVTPQ